MTEAAKPAGYKGWAGIKRAFGTPSALTMALLGFGSGLPFLLIASQTLSTRLRDVGLDLGSKAPAEIALAVVADILRVYHGKQRHAL